MTTIRHYWKGRKKLWKAFWIVWIGGSIGLTIGVGLATIILASFGMDITLWEILMLLAAVNLLYSMLAGVAVWRCARRSSSRAWTYTSRIALAGAIGLLAVMLIEGIWHLKNYDRMPLFSSQTRHR